MNRIIVSKPK